MSVMGGESWVAAAACWLSLLPAGMRWLRVAQREHYLPGSASRFGFRWWGRGRENWPLAIAALVGFGISWRYPIAGVATAVVVVLGPIGLSVRGRTSPLRMTRRLSTLAVVWLALEGGSVAIGFVVHREAFFAALGSVAVPLLVDAGCEVTAPVERWLGSRFVARARKRLEVVDPTVVAITGSFGKTSTKNYVAHLLGSSRRVVASPASYNNRAGLARTVNEYLADGTEVFVAEMGTYGRGEIAELCQWCPPDIAVITAIGPVHLERFGSEEAILEAKSEIATTAGTVVLNIDNHWLAELAVRLSLREDPPVVIRCSARARDADVFVEDARGSREVRLHGEVLAGAVELAAGVQPTNAACAIAVALALGLSRGEYRRTACRAAKCSAPARGRHGSEWSGRHRRHVQLEPQWRERSPRAACRDERRKASRGNAGHGRTRCSATGGESGIRTKGERDRNGCSRGGAHQSIGAG